LARSLGAALLLAALTLGCAPSPEQPTRRFQVSGNHDVAIAHAGRERSFILRLPPDFATRGPLPVLLAFHGGGGNASGFQKYAGLDETADRLGYALVYPDGTGRLGRRLLTWNAGACCGFAMQQGRRTLWSTGQEQERQGGSMRCSGNMNYRRCLLAVCLMCGGN